MKNKIFHTQDLCSGTNLICAKNCAEMENYMKTEIITSDVLIIGGGTSGCYAALTIAEQNPELKVVIAEKANIIRSGCLAAGVNALNAYITEGRKPEDYVDYATKDANGIVRKDLLLSMSQGLNRVTAKLEELGLVILKDENGKYVTRGNRNIKINGENIKPILAEAVKAQKNVKVINHVNITDYITEQDKVTGAYGFDVNEKIAYIFSAKAVLCATGVKAVRNLQCLFSGTAMGLDDPYLLPGLLFPVFFEQGIVGLI